MTDTQINLIKRDVGSMGQLSKLEDGLRMAALWFLGGLFVAGLAVGSTFFYLRAQTEKLEMQKLAVVKEINDQTKKEGLLLSLKDRIGIANKVLDAAKPWGKVFNVLGYIAYEGAFNSISVDDTGRVSTSLELGSIDETVDVITNIMALAGERSLRTPQMISFALRDDGRVQLTVSFFPIF